MCVCVTGVGLQCNVCDFIMTIVALIARLKISGIYIISWRHGVVVSGVRRMNEVNPCQARLVLGWVTVFGLVYHLCM